MGRNNCRFSTLSYMVMKRNNRDRKRGGGLLKRLINVNRSQQMRDEGMDRVIDKDNNFHSVIDD